MFQWLKNIFCYKCNKHPYGNKCEKGYNMSQYRNKCEQSDNMSDKRETCGNAQCENDRIIFGNLKRTYDEYQEVSLESVKRNRSYVDKVLSDAQSYDNHRQNIANQALQNAVETANMVGKQAVRHSDLAIDHQWNPIQQGAADSATLRSLGIDDASLKAIGAAVAAAVASNINR